MREGVRASARIRLTVEFDTGQSWGKGCPVEQVEKQARESALVRLRQLLNTESLSTPITIVGVPEVEMVIVRDRSS